MISWSVTLDIIWFWSTVQNMPLWLFLILITSIKQFLWRDESCVVVCLNEDCDVETYLDVISAILLRTMSRFWSICALLLSYTFGSVNSATNAENEHSNNRLEACTVILLTWTQTRNFWGRPRLKKIGTGTVCAEFWNRKLLHSHSCSTNICYIGQINTQLHKFFFNNN